MQYERFAVFKHYGRFIQQFIVSALSALPLVVATALVATALMATTSVALASQTVTDVRGRTVEVPDAASRIAIDDGRFLIALSLIHKDPVSILAAWAHDVNRLGADVYADWQEKYPALDELPRIASSAGAFNVESILAAAPDVMVVSSGAGPSEAQVQQLEMGGVPVVYIDFFTAPFENLETSLMLLATMTNREDEAESFLAFRRARLDEIQTRVASLSEEDRPTVFLEPHAGMSSDCCNSPGRGNMGDFIEFVGGHNIGADVISQAFGQLNLEYVIASDPDVYIATGGPHLERAGGLVLGSRYSESEARQSLVGVSERTGISFLTSVSKGRVHGFSHQLVNSPLDVVAIEAFATWIHPELFADIDVAATLEAINTRYLQVPYRGTYWVDIKPN